MPILQPGKIREWLAQGLADQLTQVLETMAGEKPTVSAQASASSFSPGMSAWATTSSIADGAKITLAGTPSDCSRLGSKILAAADLDLDDQETVLGTFRETIDQALSGLANATTSYLGREVSVGPCHPVSDTAQFESSSDLWTALLIEFRSGESYRFYLSWNDAFVNGFSSPSAISTAEAIATAVEPMAQTAAGMQHPSMTRGGLANQPAESKNSDLLFDVELPVCVSFGRAYLQLKDVLKLTTGSIVELNRTVSEPVEVIVNNCVIARGEVVVVEGNFGVRIQEVISRQERLRTLH